MNEASSKVVQKKVNVNWIPRSFILKRLTIRGSESLPLTYLSLFCMRVHIYVIAIFVGSSALDTTYNVRVALKKLSRPFQSSVHAKRTFRELRYLKHLKHENVSLQKKELKGRVKVAVKCAWVFGMYSCGTDACAESTHVHVYYMQT